MCNDEIFKKEKKKIEQETAIKKILAKQHH